MRLVRLPAELGLVGQRKRDLRCPRGVRVCIAARGRVPQRRGPTSK